MIIDMVLDRRDDIRNIGGDLYDAARFYRYVIRWMDTLPEDAGAIAAAMDGGTEEDVQNAICGYIDHQDYNPDIKTWVRSVKWLEDGQDLEPYKAWLQKNCPEQYKIWMAYRNA